MTRHNTKGRFTVDGYELAADRRYEPDTNLWVQELGDGQAIVGFDPLGAETTGDIVAISFVAVGTVVARGEPLATVEAAKFVGPLVAPVGGVVAASNAGVASAPGAINRDPLATWLVELKEVDDADLGRLLHGEEQVAAWFAAAVQRFRRDGVIAQ
ncbi:MAG: glycine cleavage system protein H [Solirubrobacteraceae bacterium]